MYTYRGARSAAGRSPAPGRCESKTESSRGATPNSDHQII